MRQRPFRGEGGNRPEAWGLLRPSGFDPADGARLFCANFCAKGVVTAGAPLYCWRGNTPPPRLNAPIAA